MFISIVVYFGLIYFCLMGLRSLFGSFLKNELGINLQDKILKTKLGCYMHKHRLGYIMNLAFWGDILQFFVLVVLYIKCLLIWMTKRYLNSEMYIVYFIKIIVYYMPIMTLILNFISIYNPIKTWRTSYIKTKQIALILHKSRLLQSSSSLAPSMQICTKWFALEEDEYEHLTKLNFHVELSLVVVYVDSYCDMNGLKCMLEKYEKYYMKPHIISVLCVKVNIKLDLDIMNIDKNCFDYYYNLNYQKADYNPSINIIGRIKNISESTNSKIVTMILKTLPKEIIEYYDILHTAPSYVYFFYKKIINFYSLRQATNSFFDIIDLTFRLRVIACSNLIHSDDSSITSSMGSFSKMRKILMEYDCIDFKRELYTNFGDELEKLINNKLHINVTDKMDFDSLLKIIINLRNITKAHGFIKENELRKMFQLMFCLSLYVFFGLDICSIVIYFDLNEKRPVFKFKGRLIESSENYVLFDSDRNLFISTNNGRFINMLTGEIRSRTEK